MGQVHAPEGRGVQAEHAILDAFLSPGALRLLTPRAPATPWL